MSKPGPTEAAQRTAESLLEFRFPIQTRAGK
jgi:hypothetical protein